MLLWTADMLASPTWRNLNDSFERWAFRSGFGRRLQALQRRKLIEVSDSNRRHPDKRVVRLTGSGRLHALGGRDPDARWRRRWDGKWRMALFDVAQASLRLKLRRRLRQSGFGYLQNSVWISPDPPDPIRQQVAAVEADVECFLLFEGRPAGCESDQAIVQGAWDFKVINERYRRYMEHAAPPDLGGRSRPEVLRCLRPWVSRERRLWFAAFRIDPLLPRVLLPADYLGVKAWGQRVRTLNDLARQLSAK